MFVWHDIEWRYEVTLFSFFLTVFIFSRMWVILMSRLVEAYVIFSMRKFSILHTLQFTQACMKFMFMLSHSLGEFILLNWMCKQMGRFAITSISHWIWGLFFYSPSPVWRLAVQRFCRFRIELQQNHDAISLQDLPEGVQASHLTAVTQRLTYWSNSVPSLPQNFQSQLWHEDTFTSNS